MALKIFTEPPYVKSNEGSVDGRPSKKQWSCEIASFLHAAGDGCAKAHRYRQTSKLFCEVM